MKIPPHQDILSPFMGNYFCLAENYGLAFVAIAKNGMTFLKNIAIQARTGKTPQQEDSTHKIIGYTPAKGYLIPTQKMPAWEESNKKLLKFAVWRDPVERLLSAYKFFCLEKEYRNYWCFLDLYHDHSFERFMDFVEFELKKSRPLYQDEHLRRQTDYYKPQEVDFIVPMHKLNQFLTEHGVPLQEKKANSTTVSFQLPGSEWEKRIRELYKDDYLIKTNY